MHGKTIEAGPGGADRRYLANIADLALFVNVVQAGNIAKCAKNMGFERTTVSRRIGRLERQLGARLFSRNTRTVTITDAGRRCLHHCFSMLAAADNAIVSARRTSTQIERGRVVLGASALLFNHLLREPLDLYCRTCEPVDLVRRVIGEWTERNAWSVDLGLSLAEPNLPASWCHPIAVVDQVLVGAPVYRDTCYALTDPTRVPEYSCIVEDPRDDPVEWRFVERDDVVSVMLDRNIVEVPSLIDAREVAVAGFGLAVLPRFLCASLLETGELVEILADYRVEPRRLVMISPGNAAANPDIARLRAFVERTFSR